jgi:hypothetical protein
LIIVSSSLSVGIRDVGLGLILPSVLKTSRGEERFPAPLAAARFREATVKLRTGGDSTPDDHELLGPQAQVWYNPVRTGIEGPEPRGRLLR